MGRGDGVQVGVFLVAVTSWLLTAVSAGAETTRGSGFCSSKEN